MHQIKCSSGAKTESDANQNDLKQWEKRRRMYFNIFVKWDFYFHFMQNNCTKRSDSNDSMVIKRGNHTWPWAHWRVPSPLNWFPIFFKKITFFRVKLKFRFPIATGPPSIIATGYRSLILGRADVFPAIALRQSTFYLANSIVNTHHVMSLQWTTSEW